ncbi:MAG: MarR family winged helix-turn-helix transcriptional regulator [Candidatus Sumerlaeaceae bacterium]
MRLDVREITSLNYLFLRVLSRIFLSPSSSRPLNEMTGAQKRILYYLDLQGPQRMSDIARLVGVSLPAATITVEKLVESKLVKRSADPSDRRVVRVDLTPKGRLVVRQLNRVHERRFREILSKLSPEEREELVGHFQRIHELLELIDQR